MLENHSLSTYVVGRQKDKNVQPLGTAFLVGKILVTALHVIDSNDTDIVLVLPKINNINQYQDTTDLSCKLMPVKIKGSMPLYDLCTLELSNGLHFETKAWELGNLDECLVGEELGLWGFPHCTEGRVVLTFQRAELGAKLLMGNSGIKTKYGIINILTRPGQSGSPVYSLRTGKVLGMLVGAYDSNSGKGGVYINGEKFNFTNQTSYFLSSEYITQMI